MSLVSTQKKENNIVELEISVSAEELAKATERVYKRQSKNISVPGFRKGKAPRQIIEKMYGEGIFLEDAVNDLYPGAYSEAVDEAGIVPVDRAEVEVLTLDRETGFTFKATVTVKPEVTVKDYKGIVAEKQVATVNEAEVTAEIERARERGARVVTVEGRAAKLEDIAVIDFEGFVDDVPFEGGKGEDFNLELGSGSFIGTFEDQIVGHKVGDSFDVNVTFPEEYHAEDLKGKPALFKVTVKELKAKELPELDDEFAKDISEFDTLEEYKNDLREKMQEMADKRAQDALENDLIDEVIKNLEGDIPECMFENAVDGMVRDFEQRLSSQGMNLQLYLQYTGMGIEDFRKTFREQAERQVKIRLALEKIAEIEELSVSEEELEAEYTKLAENYHMEADKIKDFLSAEELSEDLKTNKAIDLIRDSAKITEVQAKEAEEEAEKPAKKPAAKKAATKKAEPKAEGEAEEKPAKKPAAKKTAAKKAEGEAEKKPAAKKPATKKPAAKKVEEAEPKTEDEA